MPDPIHFLRQLYKNETDKDDARSRQNHAWGEPLPPHMVDMGPDLPAVARAPMYRPQTEVLGGQEFAQGVEKFFNQVPEMRGRSAKVQHGPNEPVFRLLEKSGFGPNDYAETNLNGVTTMDAKRPVSLNPRLRPGGNNDLGQSLEGTLAHEMGHVAGAAHGPAIDAMSELARGGDSRFVEPIEHDLPAIARLIRGPQPEPLHPEAISSTHDPKFYDLILAAMQNHRRQQGQK